MCDLVTALSTHLRGTACRVQTSEGKVRLRVAGEEIFYYSDVMVICDPRDKDRFFKRYPKVLIEVLSPSTEAIDRREKFLAYRQIESLEEYVLVAQDKLEVTVFRRANNWQAEFLTGSEAETAIALTGFHPPAQSIYAGVKN